MTALVPVPPYRANRRPHPAVLNALEVLELEEAERARACAEYDSEASRASRRFWRNMCLSGGSLEVLEALCRGESVPLELLDPIQVQRFGLR